jgi:hypothetical protein
MPSTTLMSPVEAQELIANLEAGGGGCEEPQD